MATEVADAPVPLPEAGPDAAAEAPAADAVAAAGDAKPAKAKKAAAPRKRANPTHPPYAEVIAHLRALALILPRPCSAAFRAAVASRRAWI